MRESPLMLALLALALGFVTSFVLAGIGEPSSLWLWRDILGVIQ